MGLFDGSNSTSSTSMPDWAQPYFQGYLGRAQEVSDLPYQPYTDQRYAGLNGTQQQALQAAAQRAMQGNEAMNTAQGALQSTAGGGYLGTAAAQNPYLNAYNQNAGVGNWGANAQNPYARSNNPYLGQTIDAAMQDTVRNYQLGVAPQMDAMAARSGSFGNSGVQQMQLEQQRQFGNTLGNMAAGMRSADYNQRAGLAENATNRQFQAGAQTQQNLYNAGQQLAQNQFSGGQAGAQAQNSLYDAERQRQMQAIGLAPTYAANDYTDTANLYNAGTALQQNQQQGLDWNYQQYQNALNYPRQQLQTLGNALGVNFGNTTTVNPGSPSTASNMLSGALLGNILFGGNSGGSSNGLLSGAGSWLSSLFGGGN